MEKGFSQLAGLTKNTPPAVTLRSRIRLTGASYGRDNDMKGQGKETGGGRCSTDPAKALQTRN